ncbi:uncharacterized protein LOC126829982 [Patella vulgata]|uniref:uncharacterized protein LOC126829982 n=1 Tax=Patella vulgata TaxID=6465 RepID=UPI0021808FA6|nr:uncharacterized protein LOC126829982 [Patella vulgata]
MTTDKRVLIFGKYCMEAHCGNSQASGPSVTVKIIVLNPIDGDTSRFKFESDSVVRWECSNYPNNATKDENVASKALHSYKIGPVVLFEGVEDLSSGVNFPTLLVKFISHVDNSNTYYIFVLIQDNDIAPSTGCRWKLCPIKCLKPSIPRNDIGATNTIFLNTGRIVFHSQEKLFDCFGINDIEIPIENLENSSEKRTFLHLTTHQNRKGDRFIVGIVSVSSLSESEEDIFDNVEDGCHGISNKLFIRKLLIDNHHNSEFHPIKSTEMLPVEYSNITSIYVHSFEEVLEEHRTTMGTQTHYISSIYAIVSNSYLLEFKSKQLLRSICLETAFKQCGFLNLKLKDNDSPSILGVFELTCSNRNKLVILKNGTDCIAVDTSSKQVHQWWNGIEKIFICDILCKGADQLLLIFEPVVEEEDISQWILTDFDRVFIDNREDTTEEDNPVVEDTCHAARTGLQKQLERMVLSVESAKNKLEEKYEFLAKNTIKLEKMTEQQKLRSKVVKESDGGCVEVADLWYQVVDDKLVLGVHVLNRTHSSISRLSLSLIQNHQSNHILTSMSKWHMRIIQTKDRISYEDDNPIIKKMKIDDEHEDIHLNDEMTEPNGILLSDQEITLTTYCDILSLKLTQGVVTLSVFLQYYDVSVDGEFGLDNNRLIMKSCKKDTTLTATDMTNNSLVDRLSQTSTSFNYTDSVLRKDRLCLDTIQDSAQIFIKGKFGRLGNLHNSLSKLQGLMYHPKLRCYIHIQPGLFYLVRIEITLSTDLKHATAIVHYRSHSQLVLFLQYLKSLFSDSIYYEPTPRDTKLQIKHFLHQTLNEINCGLSLARHNEVTQAIHKETILTEFKNKDSRLQSDFGQERQTLHSVTPLSTQASIHVDKTQKELRHLEEKTDTFVEQFNKDFRM